MIKQKAFRRAVIAAAICASSMATSLAHADTFNATFSFDNVASGSVADSVLGSYASLMHFANPDVVADLDSFGSETGTFHWVDATSVYGDVLVKADGTAVSVSNVLWNDHQPILLMFATPQDISSFSVQQDLSGFGNLQSNGSYLSFLDSSGHEIAGSQSYYTQGGNPGLLIQSSGPVNNVSAILLQGGVSYDNLSVAAVPEPETYAMLLAGIGLMGFIARRRTV